MPKRPDTAIARTKSGKEERLYSPSAAVRFAREECNFMVGDSTMRLWRSNGKGPAFERDSSRTIWYRESVLREFFRRKGQEQPLFADNQSGDLELQVVVDELIPNNDDPPPKSPNKSKPSGRPKLASTPARPVVKKGHVRGRPKLGSMRLAG